MANKAESRRKNSFEDQKQDFWQPRKTTTECFRSNKGIYAQVIMTSMVRRWQLLHPKVCPTSRETKPSRQLQ